MLRKFLPAPVIFFLIAGFTIGMDFGHTAHARTSNTLTTPVETAKKKTAAEQTLKKQQNTNKTEKKAAVSKKRSKKTVASVQKKSLKNLAGGSTKKAHIAKGNSHKGMAHKTASLRGKGKKARIARHHGKNLKRPYATASRNNIVVESIIDSEQTRTDTIDLWLANNGPDRFRQGTNDEDLDEMTLKILESAYSYLGTPYRFGGTSPAGFDCSGFVQHVFSENGISLGRSSRDQALEGKQISLYDLKPGDLLFFNMRGRRHNRIDHVGLYIGKGQFIHASSTHSREIKIEDLDIDRYLPRIVEARRVLENTR